MKGVSWRKRLPGEWIQKVGVVGLIGVIGVTGSTWQTLRFFYHMESPLVQLKEEYQVLTQGREHLKLLPLPTEDQVGDEGGFAQELAEKEKHLQEGQKRLRGLQMEFARYPKNAEVWQNWFQHQKTGLRSVTVTGPGAPYVWTGDGDLAAWFQSLELLQKTWPNVEILEADWNWKTEGVNGRVAFQGPLDGEVVDHGFE